MIRSGPAATRPAAAIQVSSVRRVAAIPSYGPRWMTVAARQAGSRPDAIRWFGRIGLEIGTKMSMLASG